MKLWKTLILMLVLAINSCTTKSLIVASVGTQDNTRNRMLFDYKESITGHYRECNRVGAALSADVVLSDLIIAKNRSRITQMEKVRVVWMFNYDRSTLHRTAVRDKVDVLAIDYRTEYGEAILFSDDAVATFCLYRSSGKVRVELVLLALKSKLK